MMPPLPAVPGTRIVRALERHGFKVARISGSHHIMRQGPRRDESAFGVEAAAEGCGIAGEHVLAGDLALFDVCPVRTRPDEPVIRLTMPCPCDAECDGDTR